MEPMTAAENGTGARESAMYVEAANPQVLPDTQGSPDERRIDIDKVGIKGAKHPIRVRSRDGAVQHTVASVSMFVNVPHHQRGTHMSRFLELLNDEVVVADAESLMKIGENVRLRLEADEAWLDIDFPYFLCKQSPVTQVESLLDYHVRCQVRVGLEQDFLLTVRVPAKSLCPCSKAISRFGAHNQRCEIEAKVRFRDSLWIEDLISAAENAASSPLYSILKRQDERYITELAYENPKFVEDIVRDLALQLDRDERITWYAISSENFESIHNHNAFAVIERDKSTPRLYEMP